MCTADVPKPVANAIVHPTNRLLYAIRYIVGVLLSLNFILFWAFPIMTQGLLWKIMLKPIFMPLYTALDENPTFRKFATDYIYSKPIYADYFAMSTITVVTSLTSFAIVLTWQLRYHSLPVWLLTLYYFSWVGFGGRIMGSAYTLSHKEVIFSFQLFKVLTSSLGSPSWFVQGLGPEISRWTFF